MEIPRPQPTFTALEKFTRQTENLMKERVASLRQTGRYDNESFLDRVATYWERVKALASRGPLFESERDAVLAYIEDRYQQLQKQANNPAGQGITDAIYIDDEPELKARLGLWGGYLDEEREYEDDSERNRFELGPLLYTKTGVRPCD